MNPAQKLAIWQWFSTAVAPYPVIWGNQDSPQPATYPFGVIDVLSGPNFHDASGIDEVFWTTSGNTVTAHVNGPRKFTLTCKILGPDAHNIIARAQLSLAVLSVQETLRNVGISVQNQGNVDDISFVNADSIVRGAQLDVIFGTSSLERTEDYGSIGTVELNNGIV